MAVHDGAALTFIIQQQSVDDPGTGDSKVGDWTDGPTRSIDGVADEFPPHSCFLGFICCPLNLIFDILAWIVIAVLVLIILLMAICIAIYGLLGGCFCGSQKRTLIRFGSFKKWLQNKLLTSFGVWWKFIFGIPRVGDYLNIIVTSITIRQYSELFGNLTKYDVFHDYTCLDVYKDSGRVYSRVLPKCDDKYLDRLPSLDKVTQLFVRDESKPYKPEVNRNASVLLAHYAQWLTHQFFNTDPFKGKDHNAGGFYTSQPVGFNLSQLYGSLTEVTNSLRLHKGGLMRSQWVNGQEWLPIVTITEENSDPKLVPIYKKFGLIGEKKFDAAIDLSNFTPGFMAIQVLWFRHHQYCARTLAKKYPNWDDERVFQTGRMIVMLSVFQVTINDYVRCISNKAGITKVTPHLLANLFKSWLFKIFGPAKWHSSIYSITAEFNLLYRWHQMIPNKIKIMKTLDYSLDKFGDGDDNEEWEEMDILKSSVDTMVGKESDTKYEDNLERLLLSAHLQHSGLLSLKNTREWLAKHVVYKGLEQARSWGLQSYNDYRTFAGMKRLNAFEDFTDNEEIVDALKSTYKSVDDIEYYPGIFAGDKDDGGFHAPLLTHIGAGLTFLGLFSFPMLKEEDRMFELITPIGCEILKDAINLDAIASLHTNLEKNSISFFTKSTN